MRWSWFHGRWRRGPLIVGLVAFLLLEWFLPPVPARGFPKLDRLLILHVTDNGTVVVQKRFSGLSVYPPTQGQVGFLNPTTGLQWDVPATESATSKSEETKSGEEPRSLSFRRCGLYLVEFQSRGDPTEQRPNQILIRDPETGTIVDRRTTIGQFGLDANVIWRRGPDPVLQVTDLSVAGPPFPDFSFPKNVAVPLNEPHGEMLDDHNPYERSRLSPDGRTLVEDKMERFVVRRAGEAEPRFVIPDGWCAFSRDSRQLAVLGRWEPRVWGEDGYRRAWRLYDLATGVCTSEIWEKIPRIEDVDHTPHEIRFGRDNQTVVTFSTSNSRWSDLAPAHFYRISVWTPSRGELVSRVGNDDLGGWLHGLPAGQSDALSLMVPVGLAIRDVEDGKELHLLAHDDQWIEKVSADERWMVIGQHARTWVWLTTVQSWLSRTFGVSLPFQPEWGYEVWKLGDSAHTLRLATNSEQQVFSQNGEWFADGTDGAITVWRLPAGRPHGRAALGALLVTALAWWRASRKRSQSPVAG